MAKKQHELRRDALGIAELTANNIADSAPAIATIFVLAAVSQAAGVGSPFVVLLAILGFFCHINTQAEFAKVIPSAGFYATYCSRAFNKTTGATVAGGYLIGVFAFYIATFFQIGLWTQTIVQQSFGFNLPWWIPAILLEGFVIWAMVRGVKVSVGVAVSLFTIEAIALLVCAAGILIASPHYISLAGFNPANIKGGAGGFGLSFVVAIFLFVGASSSSPLAEETRNPRKALPRAIWAATIIVSLIYLFMVWVMGIGLHQDVGKLTHDPFPFVSAVETAAPWLKYLLFFAGFTSAIGVLFGSEHAGSRVLYNISREGLAPAVFSQVHAQRNTPWAAIVIPATAAMVITLIFGLFMGPQNAFDYTATFSTDMFVIVYIVANVAVVRYFLRFHRDIFSWWRHAIVPVIGILVFLYPLYESVLPSQAPPYDWFGLAIIVGYFLAYVWAKVRAARTADFGSRLADDDPGTAAATPARS